MALEGKDKMEAGRPIRRLKQQSRREFGRTRTTGVAMEMETTGDRLESCVGGISGRHLQTLNAGRGGEAELMATLRLPRVPVRMVSC